MLHYYIDNYFCHFQSIDGNFDLFLVYYFSQTIDNDKNWVIVVVFPVDG